MRLRRMMGTAGIAAALVLATATMAAAQSGGGFEAGTTDIGPVIGLGGIGDAGVSIGGRFEHGIKTLPDLGNGTLSVAVSVDHYTFNEFCAGCDFSYTPFGVTLNYHAHLDNHRWDPFIGLGLGDYLVSEPDLCHGACSFNHGVYFIGRLGLRYYWQPKLALYADVGSGAGSLHLGLMFKLK